MRTRRTLPGSSPARYLRSQSSILARIELRLWADEWKPCLKEEISSKRVLVLVPHSVTEDNGITIRSKAVCAVLQHNYHVTTRSSRTPYAANALVTIAGFLAWMLKLLFLIPLQRVDCVYCCADYFGFVSAYILSKALGFRVLFEAHGILSEENSAKKRPATLVRACSVIERFVISRADYVVALSGDVVEFYKKYTLILN